MKNELAMLDKPTKSEQQVLFERLRHLLGSKHQCPAHLTVWELTNFIAVFTGEVIVCKGML
jgi:hypothetical protein